MKVIQIMLVARTSQVVSPTKAISHNTPDRIRSRCVTTDNNTDEYLYMSPDHVIIDICTTNESPLLYRCSKREQFKRFTALYSLFHVVFKERVVDILK
jgi:hypothetical protein